MMRRLMLLTLSLSMLAAVATADPVSQPVLRGTGDLGFIIERAKGSIVVFDATKRAAIGRVEGLGDLSHASAVVSPDTRHAFVFGRDGGLTKVDLLTASVTKRIVQAGNSIGGAISDDGRLVAVANYEPGGIKVFDADSLDLVADIPATWSGGQSKVVGLEDVPGRRFVFSLWDAGETWIADFSAGGSPQLTKLTGIGDKPYDALVTPDGRYYIAGLFGDDGLSMVDLWQKTPVSRRILSGYAKGDPKLPVYKMPHLEGWAAAGDRIVLPAIGRNELLWADSRSFVEVARTKVHGQPVFAVARPDGRHVWVNFAHPNNDTIQVVDTLSGEIVKEWKPGPAILHMEFAPRGHQVWVSLRDANAVHVYDTHTFAKLGEIAADSPSGIFLTARAHRTGL